MISRILLRKSSNKPDFWTLEKLSKCIGFSVFSLTSLTIGTQTAIPEFQPAAFWGGMGVYMATVGMQKSYFNGPLNRLTSQLYSDSPALTKAIAVFSLTMTVYVVCFSVAGTLESDKQTGTDGDQVVLTELNGWMAQEMYLTAKDNCRQKYLSYTADERKEFIKQLTNRELPLMKQSVDKNQARLIAHNISSFGHALQIANQIDVESILDGTVEINEEKRSLLRDQIRQQIVSNGLENEQEAIYRFMGDICSDIINSN